MKKIRSRAAREYARARDAAGIGPHDFAWKVRQRMRHDRRPVLVELQDKLGGKRYARERGANVAELFFEADRASDLPFSSLPDECLIKVNHGAAWNVLHRNGRFIPFADGRRLLGDDSDRSLDREQCIELCDQWLASRYSHAQWAYSQIPPKVYVEELLHPRDPGLGLVDLRCFTFDGAVKVMEHDSPARSKDQVLLMSPEWVKHELPNPAPPTPARPPFLDEALELAGRLGNGIDFVRVDLFDTSRGWVLAELSMYPDGGAMNSPTLSRTFNQWLADQWTLPDWST
jgi:hypothetical protein